MMMRRTNASSKVRGCSAPNSLSGTIRAERGSVMIICFLCVATTLTLGSAIMVRGLSEHRAVQRYAWTNLAFQAAEAGVDHAIAELTANPSWSGLGYTALAPGGYEVSLSRLSPIIRQVISTGHYPSDTPSALGYSRQQLEATLEVTAPSVFQFALFGFDRLRMKVLDDDDDGDNDDAESDTDAVLIDSYDSSLGSYAAQPAGNNGDLGTNNILDDSIRLRAESGSIAVHGQLAVGPDLADPSQAVEVVGNVTITSNPPVVSQSPSLPRPLVLPPATCQGDMKLKDAESLTLFESGSPYCYSKLEVKNQAQLIVQGSVTVYVGELTVKNDARLNAAGNPTQLLIQVTSNKKVKLQDNVRVVAGIYSPQSKAKLKDHATLFGSVIADRIKVMHGAAIHYDEALTKVGPSIGSSRVTLKSWRQR